jgi:hypothetical protein
MGIVSMLGTVGLPASQAHAWINSPRCQLDIVGSTATADQRTAWARYWKTMRNDVNFLTLAASQEIIANPDFHLYPIYTTQEGFSFRGPGPEFPGFGVPTGGYTAGGGPIGSAYHAAVNGLVPDDQIQNVEFSYKPTGVFNEWICQPGCYTPDQEIQFANGPVAIEQAVANGIIDLVTLSPDSTLDQIWLMENKVASFSMDMKEIQQDILVFRMASGGQLKVTTQHPIVTEDGTIKPAQDFKAGESLVKVDGSFDEILSVDKIDWFGRVFNVRPETTDLVSNVVVAQGYLNGSGRFQFEYLQELNRVILRENIPQDLLP